MQAITKYKKYFPMIAAGAVLYAAIGLYQVTHPDIPEMPRTGQLPGGLDGMNDMIGGMMDKARKMAADLISIGWGFYVTAAAAIGTFLLSRRS